MNFSLLRTQFRACRQRLSRFGELRQIKFHDVFEQITHLVSVLQSRRIDDSFAFEVSQEVAQVLQDLLSLLRCCVAQSPKGCHASSRLQLNLVCLHCGLSLLDILSNVAQNLVFGV